MKRFALLLALFVAAPAAAQPPGATPPNTQPGQSGPGGSAQPQMNKRERIKTRIRALRAYKLTEELQLDEVTAGKLFPVLARYDNEFDRLLEQRADIAKRLAAASRGGDQRAADKLVDEAVANQRAFWDVEEKRLVELRKILSATQTARLLVVLPPLERKIENQLRKAIAGKPGPGAPGPGARRAAPPPDDDDDDR
jgi:hypothetical protein